LGVFADDGVFFGSVMGTFWVKTGQDGTFRVGSGRSGTKWMKGAHLQRDIHGLQDKARQNMQGGLDPDFWMYVGLVYEISVAERIHHTKSTKIITKTRKSKI